MLDKHLDSNSHIDEISNKLSRTIGIINKLKYVLPQHVLLTLYNALMLPHINYCLLASGDHHTNKITAPAEPLLKSLNLLKGKDILKIQQLWFVYKHYNENLPTYLQNIPIILNTDVHSHNTRNKKDVHI